MNNCALVGARVFDGEVFLDDHAAVIEQEKIIDLLPESDVHTDIPKIKLANGILAPGFIDLQVNGGGGVLFNKTPTVDALTTITSAHRSKGTTSMMPTIISDTHQVQKRAVEAVKYAIENNMHNILGIHLEGPCFNPNRRGAHKLENIRKFNEHDIEWLTSINMLKILLTLAPEQISPLNIKTLVNSGIIVSAGHTDATYDEIQAGIECGIRGITHLYNAMSPLQTRAPGTVGAALDNNNIWAGIIADGHHVHDALIRLAVNAKAKKLFLVSDAMATVGSQSKSFELYDERIQENNGRLINQHGALAGSAIGMIDAVRYCVEHARIPSKQALKMASLHPAQLLQVDNELGRILPGYRADLVHINEHYQVISTWISGVKQDHT